jgi:deoxyhypusine synthase
MFQGSAEADDVALRKAGVVRIYDIFFDYHVLLSTDAFFREIARLEEFQHPMGTAEFHYRAGRYVAERERVLKLKRRSLLAAAHEYAVPLYTSSPGDSSIGMNLALLELEGYALRIDPLADVNETAAIVYSAKADGMNSGVFILGGGSPKNFLLQTEPQIQEVMGVAEKGHDYFLQITDARPDTGGLSGATPSEAVSWGKIDPDKLPSTVVCYVDSTIALPLITAYALARRKPRNPRRLYERREAMLAEVAGAYAKVRRKRERHKSS